VNHTDAHALLAHLLSRIAPEVDLIGVDTRAPLQEACDLDSMDFLNLVTALHEATGIDVPERDYPLLSTIDGFTEFVVARSAAART
jgi:acyl carrier protein